MHELTKRILSGLAMAVVAWSMIYFASHLVMVWILLSLVGLMGWEWSGLVIHSHHWVRWLYSLLCMCLTGYVYWKGADLHCIQMPWVVGIWWWLIVPYLLITYRGRRAGQLDRWLDACLGPVLFILFFYSFLMLWQANHHLVVLWVALACGSDTGAYFAGKFLGQRRLIPAVSPNKTWEGVLGGVITSCVIAVLSFWWLSGNLKWPNLLVGGMAAVTTIIGDAYISLQKRKYGLKDTGQLIPGHGGVLDRLDGLLATLPVAWLLHACWLTHLAYSSI